MLQAILSSVAGAFVAAFAAWLTRRSAAIEVFLTKASGATRSREKAVAGKGNPDMATWLAGELPPLADALGTRVARLRESATSWATALDEGQLKQAQSHEEAFRKKARFAGFGL